MMCMVFVCCIVCLFYLLPYIRHNDDWKLSCFLEWSYFSVQVFIFNMKNLDKETFETGLIRISCYDSGVFGAMNTMIGAYAFDASMVYTNNKVLNCGLIIICMDIFVLLMHITFWHITRIWLLKFWHWFFLLIFSELYCSFYVFYFFKTFFFNAIVHIWIRINVCTSYYLVLHLHTQDHELYRQWVALMDDEDADDVGVQGYLKITVAVWMLVYIYMYICVCMCSL